MKFFVDTAMIDEIRELESTGLLDGVTTNPSLIKKSGRPFEEVLKEICETTKGPVSAEVVAVDHQTMLLEARQLATIGRNRCDISTNDRRWAKDLQSFAGRRGDG